MRKEKQQSGKEVLWGGGVCLTVAFYISKNLCALWTQLADEGLLPAGVSMLDSLGSEGTGSRCWTVSSKTRHNSLLSLYTLAHLTSASFYFPGTSSRRGKRSETLNPSTVLWTELRVPPLY